MEHEYANEHCKTGVVGQTITNRQKMKKKKEQRQCRHYATSIKADRYTIVKEQLIFQLVLEKYHGAPFHIFGSVIISKQDSSDIKLIQNTHIKTLNKLQTLQQILQCGISGIAVTNKPKMRILCWFYKLKMSKARKLVVTFICEPPNCCS